MIRGPRAVLLLTGAGWAVALACSALAARVLYADGAAYVLTHLTDPLQFNDYDAQRSFASFVSQAPVLLGQAIGLQSVASYAALYAAGVFGVPAAMMFAALFVARGQPMLFAANLFAIVVFGFGLNFINSEANLFFGLALACMTILALDGAAPLLRGAVLPLLALVLLRVYEGMMLAGPVLALWAYFAMARAGGKMERLGLGIALVLFVLAAAIGLQGFLSPRDPANAARFAATVTEYFRGPQVFLLLSAIAALPAFASTRGKVRIAASVVSALFGLALLVAVLRLHGFYAYSVYYNNRGFLVLALPVFAAALGAIYRWRPSWLARPPGGSYAILLLPLACAIAGDLIGTQRWHRYTAAFCAVLEEPAAPAERLERLKLSGAMTAWAWTHPTLSVLLRARGSDAMVANDPWRRWEPFPMESAPRIDYLGLCEAPLL